MPGKRPLRKDEPQPKTARRAIPEGLDELGKKKWKSLSRRLLRLNILSEIDTDQLLLYCDYWSMRQRAREDLAKIMASAAESGNSGMMLKRKTAAGDPYLSPNPLIRVINSLTDRLNRMLVEFGMTPSSRSRIAMLPERKKKKESEAERYFA